MLFLIKNATLLLGILSVILGSVALLAAGVTKDEADKEVRLMDEKTRIDKSAPSAGEKEKLDILARQFDVTPATIQELRNEGQGWGDITLELGLARRLTRTDPTNYPALSTALMRVEVLRGQELGWGDIARELGFSLGPVISDAKHARLELERLERTSVKAEQVHPDRRLDLNQPHAQGEQPEPVERTFHPERLVH